MAPEIVKGMPLDLNGIPFCTARGMRHSIVRCGHQLKTRLDTEQFALYRFKSEHDEFQQQLKSSCGLIDDEQAFEFARLLSNQQQQMEEIEHQMRATQDDLQDCDMKKEQLDLYIQAIVRQQAVYEHMHRMYNPRHHTRHYLLMSMYEYNKHCMLEIQQAMCQLQQYEPQEQLRHELHLMTMYELHRREVLGLEKAIDQRLPSFE